jgi:hypothetical protein
MITLTTTEARDFASDACDEIEKSHNAAWSDIIATGLARSQFEAQFVARLCHGAKNIAVRWRPRVKGINSSLRLNFASVFTHQSPYVKWSTSHRCELADLLIAIIDRTTLPGAGMAVLIQAKQSDKNSTHLTTGSEKEQFDLLSGRPAFDVDAAPAPLGVDLRSYRPDDALLYGLTPPDSTPVIPAAWPSHRWSTADRLGAIALSYHVSAAGCLADVLVEQLQSCRGWKFELPPTNKDWSYFASGPSRDHWSALVNYLLEVTFSKPLVQLKNAAGTSPDRGLVEPLHVVARMPSGKIAFGILAYEGDSTDLQGFDWINALEPYRYGPREWQRADTIPWLMLNGANVPGGGGGTEEQLGLSQDNGPISAIVFEVRKPRD